MLFTAMKYTACLVDQCLQCGMMFLTSQRSREFSITGQLFFYYHLKQERLVKKSNTNYNSNASVKLFFCIRVLETLTGFQMKSSTLIELHAHVWRI